MYHDTNDTYELVCPYCGYRDSDSWELGESDDAHMCEDCGKVFEFTTENVRTFWSWKLKEDKDD